MAGPFHFRYASTVKIAALVLVALLGCKKARDCDTAIGNAIEVGKTGSSAPADGEKSAKIKGAMLAHCKADAWGTDVLACYGDGKDNASLVGCIDKLTKDQQDKLMTDLAPIISGAPK